MKRKDAKELLPKTGRSTLAGLNGRTRPGAIASIFERAGSQESTTSSRPAVKICLDFPIHRTFQMSRRQLSELQIRVLNLIRAAAVIVYVRVADWNKRVA
jgi:hypothetical protein